MTGIIEFSEKTARAAEGGQRSPRMQRIVDEARQMLRESGWGNVSMRRLATRLGVKAPSLYKHIKGKDELLVLLLQESLYNLGSTLHAAISHNPTPQSILDAYRKAVFADPHGYRLMSRTNFVNVSTPSSLDSWIREAFIAVTGDESTALAMWAFAHGLVTAELVQENAVSDGNPSAQNGYEDADKVDDIWRAGAYAFRRQRLA